MEALVLCGPLERLLDLVGAIAHAEVLLGGPRFACREVATIANRCTALLEHSSVLRAVEFATHASKHTLPRSPYQQ